MATIKLQGEAVQEEGIKEWDFLRDALESKIEAWQSEKKRKMTVKELKNKIDTCSVIINGHHIVPPESDRIIRFRNGTVSKHSNCLIVFLYKYLFETDKETFWKDAKKKESYYNWLSLQQPNNGEIEAQLRLIEEANTRLQQENDRLRKDLAAKDEQLRLTNLWYKPPPIEEESRLKDVLTFVNDVEFRKRIHLLIQSLRKGYDNLASKTTKLNTRLKWYKEEDDELRQGVFYFKSKDNYDFGIDKVTWTGFDKEGKSMEIMVHTLFSEFVNTLLGLSTRNKEALKSDATFLNQLLGIKSEDYTAIILYVGFVKDDITVMARYPAFSEDMRTLGKNFVMGSRPWWLNALDMERRKAFSWEDTVDNQRFTMGISKPYQTIRAKAPNERCFWIEVPIESETATMIMGIDVLKND